MESARAKTNAGGKRPTPLPDAARVTAVRMRFAAERVTATGWARANGESRWDVHKVLSGRTPCTHGAARRIAVKLGIVDPSPAPEPEAGIAPDPAPVACDRQAV